VSDRLSFRLLGPLAVERGQTGLNVGGPRARGLLAMLLLRSGEVVSTEALLDAVWGEVAPPTARTALQVQISKLRKVLASDPTVALHTRTPGYVLEVDPERLDTARFDALVEDGRAALGRGDAAAASDRLAAALDLWRGVPLEGLAAPGIPMAELSALEEARREARLLRVEAELTMGRHTEALPELERLRSEDPLDEASHVLSATALYRAGRQSEALAVLSTLKRGLSTELGISVGPAVDALERGILGHDPELAAPLVSTPPPQERESRKVVTVLTCRLGPGSSGDPEAERAALRQRTQMVRDVAEGHGGTVLDPMSGRVTALFGVPLTHEDDVTRAAAAALELCERDPSLRVALATDEVLVVGTGPEQRLRSSSPIEAAEELARDAAPGQAMATPATARLLHGRGAETTSADGGGAVRLLGRPGPVERRRGDLVGRAEQLSVLRAAFDRVARTRSASLVTVIGPAGVGKSTLLEHFLADVDAVAIGRCLPYGRDITYWPVAEVIRRLAGIVPEDPPEVARERIAAPTADQDDGTFVAEQLRAILGLDDAVPAADDTFWAIRRFLEAAAGGAPLVVVFDDIHWADATLLDLITYLATWIREAPVLVICLTRPELLEVRPGWGGGRLDAVNLPLDPLAPDEADELLDRLVGAAEPPTAIRDRVLEVAEGNPLFLEELAAMLAEDELLRDERGRWVRAPRLADVPIPPTVHALMAARLDRLGAEERRLLERAAVVGKDFTEDDLLAVDDEAPEQLAEQLAALVGADLLVPDDRQRAPTRAYRFRHILLRDAVYRATPKEVRANDHVGFATEFELRSGGRLSEFEEILGYHLEAAWRYRRELGVADPDLGERAARHLLSAGRRAFMRIDNPAATGLLGRARDVLEPTDPRQPELALLLAVTAFDAGDPDRALTLIDEGIHVATERGDDAMRWRLRVEEADIRAWLTSRAGNAELAAFARDALEELTRLGDRAGVARTQRLLGDSLNWEGRWSEAVESFRRGRELALEVGDEREAAERANSSVGLGPVPVEQCIEMSEAALELTRRRNPDGLMALGYVYAMAGRDDDARRLADEALTRGAELGDWREASLRMYSGLAWLLMDDPASAEATARPAVEALQRIGDRNMLASAAALLAEAQFRLGLLDDAEASARISEEVTSPDDVAGQMGWRGVLAKVLAARGELDEAVRLGRSAVEAGSGAEFPQFLGDAHMDLATVLETAECVDDAVAEVRAALTLYERKGIVPSVRRAKAVLQRLGAGP
jgi:DNA-binding SARP family transcriptional activator